MPKAAEQAVQVAELPSGLSARDEVLVCRFTGECFLDYGDYIKQQNLYRQRVWSCKYSGTGGLTYEEAVASEHKVASVVDQFPAIYEEGALRLVHHSSEAVEQLSARVLAHFGSHFVVGEELLGMLPDGRMAPCVVRVAQGAPAPAPAGPAAAAVAQEAEAGDGGGGEGVGDGVAGGGKEGEVAAQQVQQAEQPLPDPQSLLYEVEWVGEVAEGGAGAPAAPAVPGQRSTLKRDGLMRRHPSPITALTPALLRKWLETVAWAEPVTGVPGVACLWHVCDHFREKYGLPDQLPPDMAERLRPSRQKALPKVPSVKEAARPEVQFVDMPYDDEEGEEGAPAGADDAVRDKDYAMEEDDVHHEYDDDEFESDDDYRPMHPGLEARMKPPKRTARTPRRPRSRRPVVPRLMHSPPQPPPPSRQPPPPPSLQAADVQLMVESMEEVERRLQPGSIKHAVFLVLKEVGDAGLGLNEIVDKIGEKGLKTWDDPKQAKNSVASTCGHDPAFVRVGPAKFALRALVSPQQMLPDDLSMQQLDQGAQKQLAMVGQQQKEAMRRLAEETHKPKVEKNNFKCPKCHRTTHPEMSPLLLCDTCPRAYHMACLALDWRDLPSDDWCCPKCVESTQAALRRVMDLETRKREALERAANREKEAEDKLLRRLLQKEERDRRKAEMPAKGALRARILDDWEVLEEERENVGRLEIRVRELEELAQRNPLPEGGIDFADDETAAMHQRAAETREALAKLRLIIAGPPTFEPLVPTTPTGGEGHEGEGVPAVDHAVLNEAMSLAEFLRIFGAACVAPVLGVQELYQCAAWPLDSQSLPALYSSMLQCCLLEQTNHEPPAKGRARRWSRMLTLSDAVWPELLRRYLVTTRAKSGATFDPSTDPVLMSDDAVALFCADHLSRAPWWELPPSAHLRLLNVLCYDVAQGYRLRTEINARQADIVKLQTDRYREQTATRRGGKRDAMELAPVGGGGKKRKGKKGSASAAMLAEPTEEEIEEAEAEAAELDEAEGELDEAARARRQADAEYDARLQARASRTEPLGMDRYHRRYWWLRSDPGYVFVENAGGESLGAIRTKEQLDEVISKLNRRGPREGGLHRSLRKRYQVITASLENKEEGSHLLREVPRPPPEDGREPQRSVEELAAAQDSDALSEAKEKLELFITETQDIGVSMSCELREVRRQLRAAETPQQLCDFLLVLESFLGTAGEGLPTGADNISIAPLLGEAPPLAAIPSSTALDIQDTAQGGRDSSAAAGAPAVKQEPEAAGEPGAGAAAGAVKKEEEGAGAEQAQQQQQDAEGTGEAPTGMDIDQGSGAAAEVKEEGQQQGGEGNGSPGGSGSGNAAAPDPSVVAMEEDEAQQAQQQQQQQHGLGSLKLEGTCSNAGAAAAEAAAAAADLALAAATAANDAAPKPAAALGKPPLPPSAFAAAAAAAVGAQPMDDDSSAPAAAQHAQQHHRALVKSDSLAGGETSSLAATTITGDEHTQGTGADVEEAQLKPVAADDDLEDSDAEHAYLREKRMRRPARLWRSAKERAVWMKLTRDAGNMATKACYSAFLLRDRAGPMLQRFINIADEQARWEAEEKERQRLEKAESKKRLSNGGEDGPPERPLMIRTGKAKTEDGVRIVLKAMGKTPFAMGRGASSIDVVATPEQVAACRWGYQCSVCLLAGDLLCCEHPDGCNVSCHPECTGLAGLPKGPYVCMNHDSRELKTRIRRRASSSLPRSRGEGGEGEDMGDDEEETVSEDTQTADSEATEDEAPRSKSARKKPRRGGS